MSQNVLSSSTVPHFHVPVSYKSVASGFEGDELLIYIGNSTISQYSAAGQPASGRSLSHSCVMIQGVASAARRQSQEYQRPHETNPTIIFFAE